MVRGTTSRMTMTLAGSEGTNFEDMLNCECLCNEVGLDRKSGDEALSIQSHAPVAWSSDERRQSRDDAMFEGLRSRVDEVIAQELVLGLDLIVLLPGYICVALGRCSDHAVSHASGRDVVEVSWCC